jgi:hypothetical protein
MSFVLLLAAAYNLVWGAVVVLFPGAFHHWLGLPALAPEATAYWQCIGMIVGVYGIGYAAAALDPYRHWPIVLVGLLGKVFGPIGFVFSIVQGTFPVDFWPIILTNDLIWWVPFGLILYGKARAYWGPPPQADHAALLAELARCVPAWREKRSWHLSFLRHAGCTFCREALDELQAPSDGTGRIVVMMSAPEDLPRKDGVVFLSDPEARLYRLAGLGRHSLAEVLHPATWKRAWQARRHGVGTLQGDGFQRAGALWIENDRITRRWIARKPGDREPVEMPEKP